MRERRIIRTFSFAIGVFFAGPLQAEMILKIAFINTFSGASGVIGQHMYDGFMLAVDEADGKLGGLPTQVLKYDDQLKPDVGLKAAREAIERENVNFVTGFTFSNVLIAAAKPILDSKTFLISAGAGPVEFAGAKCSPYFFITSYVNPFKDVLAATYFNEIGYKRVYLMAPNYSGGREALEGFKSTFKGEVIGEVYTKLDQVDYSAELSQLQAAKPEAAYVFFPGGAGVNFVKQFYQLGLREKVVLFSKSTVDQINLPAEGIAALGSFEPVHWNPDLDNSESRRFVDAFVRKYGYIPSGFAETSYDAARLISAAVKQVQGDLSDKNATRRALEIANIHSPRGPFTIKGNHFPTQEAYLVEATKATTGNVILETRKRLTVDIDDSYGSKCQMH
jgi:branched-chain amino acid transport system substrate-binding protein